MRAADEQEQNLSYPDMLRHGETIRTIDCRFDPENRDSEWHKKLCAEDMEIIQKNERLKHIVYQCAGLTHGSVNALTSIIKEKNLESCVIEILVWCCPGAAELIAKCAVECYRTKFTFLGGAVREYTELDLKKALSKQFFPKDILGDDNPDAKILLEAMALNNHLNNQLNNSWEATRLLWLANEHDTNSTLHYEQIGVPKEVIHNIASQSFLTSSQPVPRP